VTCARRAAQPTEATFAITPGSGGEGKSVLPGTWGLSLGAFHSVEVPFFLGTETLDGLLQVFLYAKENEVGRKALSKTIMAYTTTFARTEIPTPPAGFFQNGPSGSTHPAPAKTSSLT
jgi:hypothetical protein